MIGKLRRRAAPVLYRLRKRLGFVRPRVSAQRFDRLELSSPDAPRILLLKVDDIGDMLLARGAVSVLREAWPTAELTLVTTPQGANAARLLKLFDSIHILSGDIRQRAEALSSVMAAQAPFDLAIDLRHDDDTRPLLGSVPARIRAGFDTRKTHRRVEMQIVLPLMERNDGSFPDMANEDRLKLLAQSVVNALKPSLPLDLGEMDRKPARDYVVIAPGAGRDIKCWPEAHFSALAQRVIAGHDLDIRLIGGKAEAETCRRIAAELPSGRCEIVVDRSLDEVANVVRAARAYVGNDTGVTHLAAMLETPGVCLFSGSANLSVWRARGRRMVTLYSPQPCARCRHTQLSQCRFDHACMTDITVDDVWAELDQALGSAPIQERT